MRYTFPGRSKAAGRKALREMGVEGAIYIGGPDNVWETVEGTHSPIVDTDALPAPVTQQEDDMSLRSEIETLQAELASAKTAAEVAGLALSKLAEDHALALEALKAEHTQAVEKLAGEMKATAEALAAQKAEGEKISAELADAKRQLAHPEREAIVGRSVPVEDGGAAESSPAPTALQTWQAITDPMARARFFAEHQAEILEADAKSRRG